MLRSLSSRTTMSEMTDDGDFSGGSSAASSRQHSQVHLVHSQRQPEAAAFDDVARLGDAVYRRAAAVAQRTAVATAAAATVADGCPNQWQYLPQAVWKQTAEVKKV